MNENFLKAWELLLGNEGGFTVDNGGATMWGITEAVARANGYAGDMRDLPQETAQQIAYTKYWQPFGCDLLPLPVAFQVLDTAYNGGHPVYWLQQVVGVPVDGVMGPITAQAVAAQNPWKIVALFNSKRLQYLASLQQPQYADGRMNRIAGNLQQGELQCQ
jgi:lysozyme family protein